MLAAASQRLCWPFLRAARAVGTGPATDLEGPFQRPGKRSAKGQSCGNEGKERNGKRETLRGECVAAPRGQVCAFCGRFACARSFSNELRTMAGKRVRVILVYRLFFKRGLVKSALLVTWKLL